MKLLKAFSKYAVGTFIVLIIGFVTTPYFDKNDFNIGYGEIFNVYHTWEFNFYFIMFRNGSILFKIL